MIQGALQGSSLGDILLQIDPSHPWMLLILFLVIFLENGFPPMIWLPGDSLLFMAGILASGGLLDLSTFCFICSLGAFLGYQLNYLLGQYVGLPFIARHFYSIIDDEKLKRSEHFYTRWGDAAICIGRFFPVIRTVIPFLAGISRMNFRQFTAYNLIGAILWPFVVTGLGYLCGTLSWLSEYRTFLLAGVATLFILSFFCISTPHNPHYY